MYETPFGQGRGGLNMPILYIFLTLLYLLTNDAHAADKTCAAQDKKCVMAEMESLAGQIDNPAWRDQTYRELAKSLTYEGLYDQAISLIEKIGNPDTKAMTIRGIGFAAADGKWPRGKYDDLFEKLSAAAKNIADPSGQAIAWTYVAMAQAFALDDEGATRTAAAMENPALRHKAFGETAEIQAERGDAKAAMASIAHIDSASYKNKAYRNVAKILVDRGDTTSAYKAAQLIDNPYTRTQVLQMIVNHGNAEEEDTKADTAEDPEKDEDTTAP